MGIWNFTFQSTRQDVHCCFKHTAKVLGYAFTDQQFLTIRMCGQQRWKESYSCVRIAVKMMAKIMVKMQLTMTVMVIGWPIQWSHTRRSRDLSRRFPLVGCYQPSLTPPPPSPPPSTVKAFPTLSKGNRRRQSGLLAILPVPSLYWVTRSFGHFANNALFSSCFNPFSTLFHNGGDCTVIGNFLTPMLIAVRFCLAGGRDRRQHTFGSHCHNV